MRVFTDGACSSNGKKSARSGCGIYFENDGDNREYSHTLESAKRICGITEDMKHTNNTGELLAILCALVLAAKKPAKCELTVYSDSMYCINCITLWLKKWKATDWKTAAGAPVKNKTLIQAIDAKKSEFKSVIFLYVPAHREAPLDKTSEQYRLWFGNDVADKLATQAVAVTAV
jgi:ribonuclease HI